MSTPLAVREGESPVTGWGRTGPTVARSVGVASVQDVRNQVTAAAGASRGMLARGLGRSYGDAAQNGGGLLLDLAEMSAVSLDAASACVTAGAGASLGGVLRAVVPQGFFVPVTPGTRFVTVGGAIGADVHGKNHHVDGTFGSHVKAMEIVLANGSVRSLSPDPSGTTSEEFWATIGGMGLTGVITSATFDLVPITSSRMRVDTERGRDLDDVMTRMIERDADYRYTVAWIDSVAGGSGAGRGVITRGDHATAVELSPKDRPDPLRYGPKPLASAPPFVPGGLLNRWTVSAFNEAWFRKAPTKREGEIQSIPEFFHPLDGVAHWNRIYGPRGFLQYQFVVPDDASEVVREALNRMRQAGAPSFLTVLKRFGPANPAPLSFPQPGWTLAADIPASVPGLARLLDGLDELVLAAGGRHYLAKDSRMSPETFAAGYSRLDEWRAVRDSMDPDGLFVSDQSRRLLP